MNYVLLRRVFFFQKPLLCQVILQVLICLCQNFICTVFYGYPVDSGYSLNALEIMCSITFLCMYNDMETVVVLVDYYYVIIRIIIVTKIELIQMTQRYLVYLLAYRYLPNETHSGLN